MAKRYVLESRLADYQDILKDLKARFKQMLNNDVYKYEIGSKSVTRYNLDLKALRETIAYYEDLCDEIQAELDGGGARRSVAALPRDW